MSKHSIPFLVGGVAVLGVFAVLAWQALSSEGSRTSLSAASASAGESNPTAAEIAALKPAADEAAPTTPEPEKLEPPPTAPSASSGELDQPEVPPPSPPAPTLERREVGAQRPSTFPAMRPQPGATERPPKPNSGKSGTITDFGGRRY